MTTPLHTPFPYEFPFLLPGGTGGGGSTTITGISPIESSAAVAISKLAQYLKVNSTTAKPNVQKFIDITCNQIDDIEDAFQAIFFYRMLPNAFGILLDHLGKIVGLTRNGLDDDTYRLYIQAQIAADNSAGTTEDINLIFRFLTSNLADVTFAVRWEFVAAFVVYLTDPDGILTQTEINAFVYFLAQAAGGGAKAAGVRALLDFSVGVPDDELFSFMSATDTFDGSGNGPTNSGVGFEHGFFRATVGG